MVVNIHVIETGDREETDIYLLERIEEIPPDPRPYSHKQEKGGKTLLAVRGEITWHELFSCIQYRYEQTE